MKVATTETRKLRSFLAAVAEHETRIRLRLREARLQAGYTQEQVAELLDIGKRTYEAWENEYVPWRHIKRLGEVLGRSENWILHGSDVPPDLLAERLERLEAMLGEVLRRLPGEEAPPRDPQPG